MCIWIHANKGELSYKVPELSYDISVTDSHPSWPDFIKCEIYSEHETVPDIIFLTVLKHL